MANPEAPNLGSGVIAPTHKGLIPPFVRPDIRIYQPLPEIVVAHEVQDDLQRGIERYSDKLANWHDKQGVNPENVVTLVPRQTGWVYVQSLAQAFERCANQRRIASFDAQPVNIGRWLTERYGAYYPMEYWQTDQFTPYLSALLNDEDFKIVVSSVQSSIAKIPDLEGVICLDDQFATGKTNFALMAAVSKATEGNGLVTENEGLDRLGEEVLENYAQPKANGYDDVRLGKLSIGRVFFTDKCSKKDIVDTSFSEAVRTPGDIPPYCIDKMIFDLFKQQGYVSDSRVGEINSREQAMAVGNRIVFEHRRLQDELDKQTLHEDIPNPYLYLEGIYGPKILTLNTRFCEALGKAGKRMEF